jgi:hypothetical protein
VHTLYLALDFTSKHRFPYEILMPFVLNLNLRDRMSVTLVFMVRLLEGIFIVGSVGCVAVLILTAIEDVKTLLGRDGDDEPASSQTAVG